MHSELLNLWLFAQAVAKLSLVTGFLFWLLGFAIIMKRLHAKRRAKVLMFRPHRRNQFVRKAAR